jgi:TRAP-type C4-dicarboxylate transport system permease small subunit
VSVFGVFHGIRFHWKLSRATRTESLRNPGSAELRDIEFSFAKALRLAFALGLALFANQFMQIVHSFSPRMRSADYDFSWSMPEFFLLCQMCFFPLIFLLVLEWSLTARIRRLTRPH